MIFNAPRIFATAWDSFFVQVDKLSDAWKDGDVLGAIVELACSPSRSCSRWPG